MKFIEVQNFTAARDLYAEVCGDNESDDDAWFMLGALNGRLGNFKEAVRCFHKAVSLNPEHSEAWYNLANGYRLLKQAGKAGEYFRKTLALNPFHELAQKFLVSLLNVRISDPHQYVTGMLVMGNAAQENGAWGEALACYHAAHNKMPGNESAMRNLGHAYQCLHQSGRSIKCMKMSVDAAPESAIAHHMLGIALHAEMQLSEAVVEYKRTLDIEPGCLKAIHNLGVACTPGEVDVAIDCFQRVLELDAGRIKSRSALLMNLNYSSHDPYEVYKEHLAWDDHSGIEQDCTQFTNDSDPEKKLNIAYLSPDLRSHSVAYFIEPLLQEHDASAFRIFCYADVYDPDLVTRRLEGLVQDWRNVVNLTDNELAEQIRRDKIDILIDLAGHTANNRLAVFAHKPAPVQVSYLGYPNTTGLKTMDYRLTDVWTDPEGNDRLYTETLVRLPKGFLCYDPHYDAVEEGKGLQSKTHFTFGSFNNLAKVTPDVIALWSQLLESVAGSRLILKTKSLCDASIRESVYRKFESHGIERERVEMTGCVPDRMDHLGQYEQVDIALDTFPYNGTTTTCEALWMGVPVITLAGDTHVGRVGVSLLSQVGLTELIATDKADYLARAVALSNDSQRLADLRANLREQVATSSLCDASGFTRQVEASYRQMWQHWCKMQGD